jgi:molecular chaperone DnaK (HSP70)
LSFESDTDLISNFVIAIDFGTTFSGVAYARQNLEAISAQDINQIAKEVLVVKDWPEAHNQDKIPTLLCYKTNPPTWGHKARRAGEPRVAHFKLGLQKSNDGEKHRSNSPPLLQGFLENHNWRHPDFPAKEPVNFAADYLRSLIQHVLANTLPKQFDKKFLKKQEFSYIMTVPGILTDKAQQLAREAAYRAGIPFERLTLITEPEAVAVYCATLYRVLDLKQGDHFLICDAGGGIVVHSPLIDLGSTNILGSHRLYSAWYETHIISRGMQCRYWCCMWISLS